MANLFDILAARALGQVETIQPRHPARFESLAGSRAPDPAEVSEEVVAGRPRIPAGHSRLTPDQLETPAFDARELDDSQDRMDAHIAAPAGKRETVPGAPDSWSLEPDIAQSHGRPNSETSLAARELSDRPLPGQVTFENEPVSEPVEPGLRRATLDHDDQSDRRAGRLEARPASESGADPAHVQADAIVASSPREARRTSTPATEILGIRVAPGRPVPDTPSDAREPDAVQDQGARIVVEIGRVEVRAVQPAIAAPRPRPERPRPAVSLSDHLTHHRGGRL